MKFPTRLILTGSLLALLAAAQFVATTPASAITVELANKCREMSLKAFQPQRAGTKGGNAGEARKYYNACVANNGVVPEDKPQKPATAPAR
ncbi:MAG: hypothetical protein Q8M24_11135 [Pseudolabrys sp.]|nr:hypothetical protein [Pseudolabrys sp.]MDP2296000.1 hypothetical protein [Pseudolabrys sp.]